MPRRDPEALRRGPKVKMLLLTVGREKLACVRDKRDGELMFTVREVDQKLIRGKSKTVSNEQAHRVAMRSKIISLQLPVAMATDKQIRAFKDMRDVLGPRAPSCMLIGGGSAVQLLRAFDRKKPADELESAMANTDDTLQTLAEVVQSQEDADADPDADADTDADANAAHDSDAKGDADAPTTDDAVPTANGGAAAAANSSTPTPNDAAAADDAGTDNAPPKPLPPKKRHAKRPLRTGTRTSPRATTIGGDAANLVPATTAERDDHAALGGAGSAGAAPPATGVLTAVDQASADAAAVLQMLRRHTRSTTKAAAAAAVAEAAAAAEAEAKARKAGKSKSKSKSKSKRKSKGRGTKRSAPATASPEEAAAPQSDGTPTSQTPVDAVSPSSLPSSPAAADDAAENPAKRTRREPARLHGFLRTSAFRKAQSQSEAQLSQVLATPIEAPAAAAAAADATDAGTVTDAPPPKGTNRPKRGKANPARAGSPPRSKFGRSLRAALAAAATGSSEEEARKRFQSAAAAGVTPPLATVLGTLSGASGALRGATTAAQPATEEPADVYPDAEEDDELADAGASAIEAGLMAAAGLPPPAQASAAASTLPLPQPPDSASGTDAMPEIGFVDTALRVPARLFFQSANRASPTDDSQVPASTGRTAANASPTGQRHIGAWLLAQRKQRAKAAAATLTPRAAVVPLPMPLPLPVLPYPVMAIPHSLPAPSRSSSGASGNNSGGSGNTAFDPLAAPHSAMPTASHRQFLRTGSGAGSDPMNVQSPTQQQRRLCGESPCSSDGHGHASLPNPLASPMPLPMPAPLLDPTASPALRQAVVRAAKVATESPQHQPLAAPTGADCGGGGGGGGNGGGEIGDARPHGAAPGGCHGVNLPPHALPGPPPALSAVPPAAVGACAADLQHPSQSPLGLRMAIANRSSSALVPPFSLAGAGAGNGDGSVRPSGPRE